MAEEARRGMLIKQELRSKTTLHRAKQRDLIIAGFGVPCKHGVTP
jgi:hypothetical protein